MERKTIVTIACCALFFGSPVMLAEKAAENTVVTDVSEDEIQYTYKDLNKTMYATGSVNIRTLPSIKGDKVGMLSKNQEVTVTGRCNETGWYRIKKDGKELYVSDNYLSSTTVSASKPVNKEEISGTDDKTSNITYITPKGKYTTENLSLYTAEEKEILTSVLNNIAKNKNNNTVTEEYIEIPRQLSREEFYKITSYLYVYYGNRVALDDALIRASDTDEQGNKQYYIKIDYEVIRKLESDLAVIHGKVDEILSTFTDGDEKSILKQIADYLESHITYVKWNSSVQNALLDGQASCNGYAMAFQMLANRAGINTDLCIGAAKSGEYHAWNIVTLKNNTTMYYDITFYDTDTDGIVLKKYLAAEKNFHGKYYINDYSRDSEFTN